ARQQCWWLRQCYGRRGAIRIPKSAPWFLTPSRRLLQLGVRRRSVVRAPPGGSSAEILGAFAVVGEFSDHPGPLGLSGRRLRRPAGEELRVSAHLGREI